MKSIKTKIFVIFLSAVALTVGLIIVLNATLFLRYSISRNEKLFMKIAYDIIAYAEEVSDDEEVFNYTMKLINSKGILVTTDSVDVPLHKLRPRQNEPGLINNKKPYQYSKKTNVDGNILNLRITSTPWGKQENLELHIRLKSGMNIMLMKPIGILMDNVDASNNFILMASCFAIIVGGLVVYFLVDRQTKPIVALHKQTEKIAKLDFSDRFKVKGSDEIAKLGENINNISDELSQNINALQNANEKLQSDVDILKEVDEMRKQFIAAVSHEFKTPIGVIKSYADGIKYGVADNEVERDRFLDIIVDESDRMTRMVKDLVQLMKMDLKEYKIEKESVNLLEFLSESNNRYRGMIVDKEISLTIQKAPDIKVLMDISRITQILDNFVSNAIRHTPGGGSITIWAEKIKEGICISVKNTGSHIDEEKLPYIWDSFYKIDKARSRDLSGSGLGLSIVKGIMEAHGGKYGVRNTEDGIVFFIVL